MWDTIEKILKEKNLNQDQLDKRMKVHSGTVSDLKKGGLKNRASN